MSRTMPFALELQGFGAVKRQHIPYASRQSMQNAMHALLRQKPPFVGEMYPLVEDQGDWTIDGPSAALLQASEQQLAEYRRMHLRQAGEMFLLLSQQKEMLSAEQVQELIEQLRAVFASLGMMQQDAWLAQEEKLDTDPFLAGMAEERIDTNEAIGALEKESYRDTR